MSGETGTGTQTLDSSSETTELRLRQETEMEPALLETPADELTLRSFGERIKQATDPILRRVEELCALLASRTKMESACNYGVSGSRRNCESSSRSHNRYDTDSSVLTASALILSTHYSHKKNKTQLGFETFSQRS